MATLFRSSLAVAVGSLALVFAANPSQALTTIVTVNVGGTNYDVTYSQLSYDSDTSKYQTLPAGQMPWWGNSALAQEFATQVGNKLGILQFSTQGPIFAFGYLPSPNPTEFPNGLDAWVYDSSANPNITNQFYDSDYTLFTATASLTPTPSAVPGPLPLFGAAAAFGMSRRLRRRIKLGG